MRMREINRIPKPFAEYHVKIESRIPSKDEIEFFIRIPDNFVEYNVQIEPRMILDTESDSL